MPIESGYTGAEIARMILRNKDVNDVEVVETAGVLSDHIIPKKTARPSAVMFIMAVAAAAGVAAHEVGHALQHAHGSLSLGIRSWLAPAAGFGSGMAPIIIFVGALLGGFQQISLGSEIAISGLGGWITAIGIAFFGAFTVFTLVTVPNEYNASARAKTVLSDLGGHSFAA